jgi:hypothetical protein
LTTEEQRISVALCKQTKELIERRNDIIHATWFIGYAGAGDTDFSEASGHKWKRGKTGALLKSDSVEAAHFEAFAEECSETANIVMFLPTVVIFGLKLGNNFRVNEDGRVVKLTTP